MIAKTKEMYRTIMEGDAAIQAYAVHENCIDRQGNYDVLIELWFEDAGVLGRYLESEGHRRFVTYAGPHVLGKVSFDYSVETQPLGNELVG
jgi:hypothetical protein